MDYKAARALAEENEVLKKEITALKSGNDALERVVLEKDKEIKRLKKDIEKSLTEYREPAHY